MISIKMNEATKRRKPAATQEDDTLLPLELTHVPGIIDAQVAHTESVARYPNRRTAFVGALSMLAFAAGRRYRTEDNTRTNEYFVCYANSGSGKDAPRKTNREIAVQCGCSSCVADAVGSGEGLQDAIMNRTKFLLQNDEFDTLVRAIAEDKSGSKESLVRELLSLYTSSGSLINRRALSTAAAPKRESTNEFCVHPHFCLFGSCVGQYLFETLNDRVLENGLIARCLLVDCGKRQNRQRVKWHSVPGEVVASYRDVLGAVSLNGEFALTDRAAAANQMTVIGYDDEAAELNEDLLDRYDAEYERLDDGQHAAEQSFMARTGEHFTKMAMIYAISQNPRLPVITVDALKWADAFVTHCQRSMMRNVERFTAANPHEANAKRIMRKLERCPTITLRDVCRCLRLPVATARETTDYLIAIGEIVDAGNDVYHRAAKACHISREMLSPCHI